MPISAISIGHSNAVWLGRPDAVKQYPELLPSGRFSMSRDNAIEAEALAKRQSDPGNSQSVLVGEGAATDPALSPLSMAFAVMLRM